MRVKIYNQVFTTTAPVELYDLSANIEQLRYGTNAFGGFSTCAFILKMNFENLWTLLEDIDQKGLLCRRLAIVNPRGTVVWEGVVYDMTLDLGGQMFSRTLENTFTGVRFNHNSGIHGAPKQYTTNYNYAMVQQYGMKVYVDEDYEVVADPYQYEAWDRVNRVLETFSTPPRFNPIRFGGQGETISMRVSARGLHATLAWRYAWNSFTAKRIRTNKVLEQLLKASPYGTSPTFPNPNVCISSKRHEWMERLIDEYETYPPTYNGHGWWPWGQQFLSTDFQHFEDTGVNCATNIGSGSNRMEIIRLLLKQGGTVNRRMFFQVWNSGRDGKGIAYFRRQAIAQPFTPTYEGYYYSAKRDEIFDKNMTLLPFSEVRAGNWLTVTDISTGHSGGANIFANPNCFHIEETDYDADRRELTVSTSNDFDLRRILSTTLRKAQLKVKVV